MLELGRIVRRLRAFRRLTSKAPHTSFAALSEVPPEHLVPVLDRAHVRDRELSPLQRDWRQHGLLQLPKFIPEPLLEAYEEVHQRMGSTGWQCPVPYMHLREVRDVCLYRPLADTLKHLIGAPMALHFNDTTGHAPQGWHQDDYRNPSFVNAWWAGVWIALDNQQISTGFEYVPGSHRWPVVRGERVRCLLSHHEAEDAVWTRVANPWVSKVYSDEIARRGTPTKVVQVTRGDVFVWHGRLVKRDAPGHAAPARALVAHFSAISKRIDMPHVAWTPDGAAFFVRDNFPLDDGAQRAG